jgi:hypothetical protein
MKIEDSVLLGDALVVDESGYLRVNARTARTGIQVYGGAEVGRPELALVNVFRDEAEVFAKRSLNTFANIPITMGHPEAGVTAQTWRDKAVGNTLEEVLRDGEYLKIGLKIMDAAAVQAVKDGTRELSVGYETELVWGDGVAPDGTKYQARQTGIVANHIAIVPRGRAGKEVRIGDASKWGAAPITPTQIEEKVTMSDALRTVVVDGLSVQTTDQGAQAITKLQKDLADSTAKIETLTADHAKALATKDADLAKAHAERDDAKAKILSDADLEKRVAARADLIDAAKKVAPKVETKGLSDAAIRKAVVVAVKGEDAVKDKSDAYLDVAFDLIVEDAAKNKPDAFRQAVQSGVQPVNDAGAAVTAHKAYTDHLTGAWQNQTKGAA